MCIAHKHIMLLFFLPGCKEWTWHLVQFEISRLWTSGTSARNLFQNSFVSQPWAGAFGRQADHGCSWRWPRFAACPAWTLVGRCKKDMLWTQIFPSASMQFPGHKQERIIWIAFSWNKWHAVGQASWTHHCDICRLGSSHSWISEILTGFCRFLEEAAGTTPGKYSKKTTLTKEHAKRGVHRLRSWCTRWVRRQRTLEPRTLGYLGDNVGLLSNSFLLGTQCRARMSQAYPSSFLVWLHSSSKVEHELSKLLVCGANGSRRVLQFIKKSKWCRTV